MSQDAQPHDLQADRKSPRAEYRPLTPDEMKQFDAMLGHTGPTLIRRADPAPDQPRRNPRLLHTIIVAIILLSIVAAALYLFR